MVFRDPKPGPVPCNADANFFLIFGKVADVVPSELCVAIRIVKLTSRELPKGVDAAFGNVERLASLEEKHTRRKSDCVIEN